MTKHSKQKTESLRAWDVAEDRWCRYATRVPNIITMISLGARTHRASINLAEDGGTTQRICILDDTGFAIMIQRHGLAKPLMCLFIRHKLSRSRAEERAARVVLGLGLGPPRIRSPVPANDKCTGRVTITKEPVQECYGSSRNSKAALICPHPSLESPQIFVPIRGGGLNLFCCSTKIEKVTSSRA